MASDVQFLGRRRAGTNADPSENASPANDMPATDEVDPDEVPF